MIQMQSSLSVADNSGAKKVKCIKVLGGSKKMSAQLGDLIKVSVTSAIPRAKVKKGEIYLAVIVRTAYNIKRDDMSVVKFFDNAVVLLSAQKEPVGTRIFGAIPRELRYKNFMKIISLAPEVI